MNSILLVIALAGIITINLQENNTRIRLFPKAEVLVNNLPKKEITWVFIRARQSNMAGCGQVEPTYTIPNLSILTINKQNQVILAKEPLRFYEPNLIGLENSSFKVKNK